MQITKDEFEQANANMKELQSKSGIVRSAIFDPNTRSIILKLSTGIGVFFSPEDAQGLEHATPEQLSEIEITPPVSAFAFPSLMPTSGSHPSSKASSAPGNGWPPASEQPEAARPAPPKPPPPVPTAPSADAPAAPP